MKFSIKLVLFVFIDTCAVYSPYQLPRSFKARKGQGRHGAARGPAKRYVDATAAVDVWLLLVAKPILLFLVLRQRRPRPDASIQRPLR